MEPTEPSPEVDAEEIAREIEAEAAARAALIRKHPEEYAKILHEEERLREGDEGDGEG